MDRVQHRLISSLTDGFSYERVAQFNLEWIFSKLDSGFLVLDSLFQSPGFRIPRAKNSWIPESGFPYMGRIRGLESLGASSNQYGRFLIPVIMSKLPHEIRVHVARNTACEVWDMTELLEVIR